MYPAACSQASKASTGKSLPVISSIQSKLYQQNYYETHSLFLSFYQHCMCESMCRIVILSVPRFVIFVSAKCGVREIFLVFPALSVIEYTGDNYNRIDTGQPIPFFTRSIGPPILVNVYANALTYNCRLDCNLKVAVQGHAVQFQPRLFSTLWEI
jgi:hypothetical protein